MVREVKEKIIQCINEDTSFVLEAGAGAGKTHTLMETLNFIQSEFKHSKVSQPSILCITYTNIAKNEIRERTKHIQGIKINTLHEFLWDFIKQFQLELKKAIIDMIEEDKNKIIDEIGKAERLIERPRKNTNVEQKKLDLEKNKAKLIKYNTCKLDKIRYEGYRALYKGVISHKDIINISIRFLKENTFANLFINGFTHIFIDEFQDTNKDILLQLMETIKLHKKEKYLVIGLFGDRMQQIYSGQALDIDYNYYQYEVIPKLDNYRSCKEIILANNILRNDGLHQEHKNQDIKYEKLDFIFNVNKDDMYLKQHLGGNLGGFQRLFLNHREIAEEVGFINISRVFTEEYTNLTNDKLLKREDTFLDFLMETVLPMAANYLAGNHQLLLKNLNRDSFGLADLTNLNKELNKIFNTEKQLRTMLEGLINKNIVSNKKVNGIIKEYAELDKAEFIDQLLEIQLQEYLNLYRQINNETRLQTLHGVKGDEFDKVVINIRHQQSWNQYNFDSLFMEGFNGTVSNQNAHKLFYVACTRAKSALIINYISEAKDEVLIKAVCSKIQELFGNFITTYVYESDMIIYNSEQLV
ncbi:UvrD-helicase domain-containing protein [Metabacillus sp. 22489]|uniref:UvrD-helicase domain-containing protein n=1 Tax=Metabacillus sp. 22489 TaxID=3453928 RepID=UPI003F833948